MSRPEPENNQHSTLIHSEVNLDQDGKHCGYLRIPHSVHRSAYGWIPVPIVSVKNGDGPVALLMAGNHGDEYEGQVALCNLTRRLEAEQIHGQVIILPMANYPAARAGLRTSPIDQGNLNRSFPGKPNGTPTEMIAHYIESELLKRADYLLDLHSGGSSLLYKPTALMPYGEDLDARRANLRLVKSLGLPTAVLYPENPAGAYSSSAARRNNVVSITAEMAGGGNVNVDALALLDAALDRYLGCIGICPPLPDPDVTTLLETPSQAFYVYSHCEGLFEPKANINDEVTAGQLAGLIHKPERPWDPPEKILFAETARVICMRVPARVEHGDCVFELARPFTG